MINKRYDVKVVGKRLQQARQRASLNPIDVAMQFGVDPKTIQRYEHLKTMPPLDYIVFVAEKTNFPMEFFFVVEENDADILQALRLKFDCLAP